MNNKGIELLKDLLNEDCHKIELTTSEAWEKLKGNGHVKRAIEVSLAGQHPITIIGDPDNGAQYLKNILGDLLTFIPPCPCGNFLNLNKSCLCSVSKLTKHRTSKTWQKALKNPIIVQLQPPTKFDYQIKQHETFQNIIDRINRKPDKSYHSFESDSMDFLKVAIERLSLSAKQVDNILSVAKTIAELDNLERIIPYHLSEAIQYQNITNF